MCVRGGLNELGPGKAQRGGEGGIKCREEGRGEVRGSREKHKNPKQNLNKIQVMANKRSQQKDSGFMRIIDGYRTENDNCLCTQSLNEETDREREKRRVRSSTLILVTSLLPNTH